MNTLGIFKPANKSDMTSVPYVDERFLIAAALLSLIVKHAREKPSLSVPECMKHAGISTNLVTNKALQMRVRRIVKKLDLQSVLHAVDDALLVTHEIQPTPVQTQQEAMLVRALKAAVLIHLVDTTVNPTPLLTAYDCMIHAGIPPIVAEDPTSLLLVRRLVSLLRFDEVVFRVNSLLISRKGITTPPDDVQVGACYSF
jgi:hypothetical protein